MKKTTKPRILFLLHLPPPVHGSSVVGQSIKNSKLINESFECQYVNLLISKKINETGKSSTSKFFRFIGIWFNFIYSIIFKRPDLCYLALTVSGSAFFKDVLLITLLRVFRIQHVFHLHNKGVSDKENNVICNRLYKYVFKKAEVILLSSHLYSDIEHFVPLSRVHICPNGIDDVFINHKIRTVSENRTPKLLFLSNLIVSKGVYVLLDACSILHRKGIDFECNFVGAEGDICESEFKEIVVNLGLTDKVHYLGMKFCKEKNEMFETADIFAFPTYFECFGLVNLEAMQCSLPIVSTLEGGIPDIIDDGVSGFLVAPNNAEAFAEKLEVLINDPELRIQMGKEGRIKYDKEFKLDQFELNLLKILDKISRKKIEKTTALKKILFILHLPPPVHGSSIVGKQIFDSKIVNNSFDCDYINLLVSRTLTETGKSSSLKIYRFLIIWFKFLFQLIIKKPDLCYIALTVSGSAFFKDVLLIGVLRLFRIKRIYHLHNKGVSKFQQKKRYKFLYPFVFNKADVILLSSHLYHDIDSYVPLSRIHICPNGIKNEVITIDRDIKSFDDKIKILFLSNLIDSKGVTVLIEACSLLKNRGLNFECNYIGAEGDVDAIQFEEKLRLFGVENNIRYLGQKYGLDKREYFANADIFAFPTFYPNECFPLVILEAMSYSLPVISTFEGGIRDEIEDGITGYVIEQKNVLELANKLELLILNPQLRLKMGEAGRKKFEKEFDLNCFEQNLGEILSEVV